MKFYNQTVKNVLFLCAFFLPVLAFPRVSLPQEENEEETYAISLIQTAEEDKEILEVEDKKVLAETYTIRKNDYVWKLLRERF